MFNELSLIQQMLNTERDCIKVNKKLFEKIGIEAAIIYSYLVGNQINEMRVATDNISEEDYYILYSVESIQKATTLSAFKQRNALEELQARGLIKIKMGQSKSRYISVVCDSETIKNMLFNVSLKESITESETIQYFLKQFNIFKQATKRNISKNIFEALYKEVVANNETEQYKSHNIIPEEISSIK